MTVPSDLSLRCDQPSAIATQWQLLRAVPLQASVWLEMARGYAHQGLPWQAGYAARQTVRCDAGLRLQLEALDIGPWLDASQGDALLGRAMLPEAAALAARFSSIVDECPGDWLTWLYLSRLQEMPGVDGPGQEHSLEQAKALEVIPGESLHWLGVWRLNAGDAQGAVAALSALLDARPLRYGSMMYLGEALLRTGNIAAAEQAFTRASLSPNPEFLHNLALKVFAHNYWQEAIAILQKAIALRPSHVPTWLALAKIQSEVYALADCRQTLCRLRELEPGNQELLLLEAGLQGRMGNAHGYLSTLRAAYEAGDPLSRLASSVAMTALYHDELPSLEVADLHRRLCAPIEAAVRPMNAFLNDRSPNRRLRLGYVTGDLHRQHPVNIFMLPVLLRHDHAKFEIFVYHTGTMHDEYTRQAKSRADHWLEAALLDDATLRQAIVADGIDILVDLAGHTATHRLGVFAMRAAPVQATFLGYPHSTGLSTMDWIVGDATVTPAEHAPLFSEGLAQLPDSVFCWAPAEEYALPPPRPAEAPVVFGSFNNAMKLSPKTIRLWSRILLAAPEAKLLLKAPSLKDEAVQARFFALFAEQGLARERLLVRGPSGLADMMQEYGDIDIALDPTPYNGGTTTLQALWMGVPVVTLEGNNFVSRMGASFLRTLGRPDWVARDEATYMATAVALAGQVCSLRHSRSLLRAQMAASPLSNIDNYVSNLEDLYFRMWSTWRDQGPTRLLTAVTAGSEQE